MDEMDSYRMVAPDNIIRFNLPLFNDRNIFRWNLIEEESNMANPPYILDGPALSDYTTKYVHSPFVRYYNCKGDVLVINENLGKLTLGTSSTECNNLYRDEWPRPYSNHTIFEYRDTPRDIGEASNNGEYLYLQHRMLSADLSDYDEIVNQYTGPQSPVQLNEASLLSAVRSMWQWSAHRIPKNI
jgi:hypothetical protein